MDDAKRTFKEIHASAGSARARVMARHSSASSTSFVLTYSGGAIAAVCLLLKVAILLEENRTIVVGVPKAAGPTLSLAVANR